MNWQQITVKHFQQIHQLSLDTEMDEVEKVQQMLCILNDLTPEEVDDMELGKYNRLAKEAGQFLSQKVPGKAKKYLWVGQKKFAIQYDPAKLKHRQHVETLTYGKDLIANLHLVMASIVEPVRFGFRQKNKGEDHAAIAELMLEAPITAVFHTCVFFCRLYLMLIKAIRPAMMKEMIEKGLKMEEASSQLAYLESTMAGFIQPKELQSTNVSH